MHLDTDTIEVLKNFSGINPNLYVQSGKPISTISPSKTIIARSVLDKHVFEDSFGIYDLSKLLSRLSLFVEPQITIKEDFLIIKDNEQYTEFGFSNPDLLSYPKKDISVSDPDFEFDLTKDHLAKILKALNVSGLPEFALLADGKELYVSAIDSKGSTKDVFKISVGKSKQKFKFVFKAENIKLLSDDYKVSVYKKGIAYFRGNKVEYWIAVEKEASEFNE